MEGKIIRGVGGLYYVHVHDEKQENPDALYECRAKGIFRKDKIKPLPGDFVEIAILDEEKKLGNIERILPRKNVLIRPAVANVDQALVIFALAAPAPSFSLLDRFLVMMEQQDIPSVLLFNKKDLVSREAVEEVTAIYEKSGYPMLFVSAAKEEGIEAVRRILQGKTTTVAGPSGVGKSSLINLLQNDIHMETGEISEKIARGRHTTRHTELLCVDADTYILDTPGFSSMDLPDIEKEGLGGLFPEIKRREGTCRFADCAHMAEPDCSVQRAVSEGEMSGSRYENYRAFYEELKAKKRY